MVESRGTVHEAGLSVVPLRNLKLSLAGTPLEPLLHVFENEVQQRGICRLKPHFYLSTEWGVPFDTISIAIPFYLARVDLTEFHRSQCGYVEGANPTDILRYLRHEMGHVVNYAYKLYEDPEWVRHFGAITQPYEDEYRPLPFSRDFVSHLPGWYAQKHPDEDWAETFAVWLTPGMDWRSTYAQWPTALAKLEYCDRVMTRLRERDPLVTATEADEDVSQLDMSLADYYRPAPMAGDIPAGLGGALQALFDDLRQPAGQAHDELTAAGAFLRRLTPELAAHVYRWTGHFPERTSWLLQQMAERAEALGLAYQVSREGEAAVAVATLVTALATNFIRTGRYSP